MIQVEGIFAGQGGAPLNVVAVPVLPDIVVENQITVITSTTPGTIYVDTDEPANPVSGDVWVQVGSSDYGVEFSEIFRNGLKGAKQYKENDLAWLDGYVGINGTWERFAQALPAKGTPLEQWTWEEIIILANSDWDAEDYFAVGDEKNLVLTTGEVVPVVIGDFNHNTITNSGGKKASIAFTFKNCLNTTYPMNSSDTTNGGWNDSVMRKTRMANILNTFPAELRADGAIKYVDVIAPATTSSDRLRLHSLVELGLSYSYAASGEGTKYAYYTSGNRVKTVGGVASIYWTRSPNIADGRYFCCVIESGAASYTNASYSFGVACGFDI